MKKIEILLIASLLFVSNLFSQIEIQTQQLPEEIELGYSYITEDGSIIKARAKGENIVFSKFDVNMNLTQKDIKVKFVYNTENGKNYYQYMELIGECIYVFAKQHDDKNKKVNVIVQSINIHTLEVEIEPSVIFSYPLLAGFWSDSDYGVNDFSYEVSKNKKYILFSHYVASDQEDKFNKAYKLFDNDLKKYWSITQADVYTSGSINNYSTVSNNGLAIINKRLYHRDSEGNFLKQTNNFNLYNLSGEEIKEISILEEQYSIGHISVGFSEDGYIYFSGVYYIDKWDTEFHEGIASWNYNYKTNLLSEIAYNEIPQKILTKYYSEKQNKKYQKNRNKFTVTSLTYRNYYVEDIICNKQGAYIILDRETIGLYDGILVLYCSNNNEIQWVKQLPKFKRKSSDYEFSSFAYPFLKDNNLQILYTERYDNLISPKNVVSETEANQNSLIMASIDESGEYIFSNILSYSKNDKFDFLLQYLNVYKYNNIIYFFSKKDSQIKIHQLELN